MSQTLQEIGGVPPYTWTALDTLPAGLTLNSAGVLSGTPTIATAGAYYTVQVQDALGATATVELWLTVLGVADPVPPVVEVLKRQMAIAAVLQVTIARPASVSIPVLPVLQVTIVQPVSVRIPVLPVMTVGIEDVLPLAVTAPIQVVMQVGISDGGGGSS